MWLLCPCGGPIPSGAVTANSIERKSYSCALDSGRVAPPKIQGKNKSTGLLNRFTTSEVGVTPKRRATIRDVARKAGVSPATVSRYLNKKLQLPPESARRIEDAIWELDYKPNALARNLSVGETRLIGFVVPDIQNPFFAALAAAVERAAYEAGYRVLLCNTENQLDKELAYLDLLSHRIADGILLVSNHAYDAAVAAIVAGHRNVVVLDEDIPSVRVHRVLAHNERGGWLATRHLIDNGHRQIAHVGGPEGLFSADARYAGFRRAMEEAGLDRAASTVIRGPYTYLFGEGVLPRLRDLNVTAVFCASDYVAVGALNAAIVAGLAVPRELSIVGFDDMPFANMLNPPLTTVRQPILEMGRLGVELLTDVLAGSEDSPRRALLDVDLVVRGSVWNQVRDASPPRQMEEA